MKISKILVGAVAAVAMVGFFGCKSDNDENDMLSGYSISLTNNGTLTADGKKVSDTNPAITYARSWNVTASKHLSANATITIDRTTKSTKVGQNSKATEGNAVTTTDGGNNASYIFGLSGSGTADKPYSFYLLGFRLNGTKPQYFISYYTGVQSTYCNSDANDFDVDDAANTAYEYVAVNAWSDLPSNAYTLTDDALSVYIDLKAIYGTDQTVVTSDNYSTAKKAGMEGYKVTLKKSADETTGTTKTLIPSNFTAQTYTKKTAPALGTSFNVDQAYLGFYAMVAKDKTLVANLEFAKNTTIRSIDSVSVDTFGNTIDMNGEVLTNF